MANTSVVVLDSTLTDIANAIRGKNGSQDTYKPSEMPAAITAIPTGGVGIPREVSQSGVFQMPSSTFTYSLPAGVTDLGKDVLYEAFGEDTYLTGIDFSGLTSITGHNAMYQMCYGCTNLTSVDLSSLTSVSGSSALYAAFYGCTSLASASFPALATVSSDSALYAAFYGCTNLTSVSFPALTTVRGSSAFDNAFSGCTNLTSVSFPALTTVDGAGAFVFAFHSCTSLTSISFPALTTSSFGTATNQFSNMLIGCSGVTVHFPAAIQSTIGGWSSVKGGFGGTNTTVLFDL